MSANKLPAADAAAFCAKQREGLQREKAASSSVRAGPLPRAVNHLFERAAEDGRDSLR